jgi:hypothetical protein
MVVLTIKASAKTSVFESVIICFMIVIFNWVNVIDMTSDAQKSLTELGNSKQTNPDDFYFETI